MDKKFKDWYESLPGERNDSLMAFGHTAYLLGKSVKNGQKKDVDECYPFLVEDWTKTYPEQAIGFNGVDGNKIKSIIKQLRKAVVAGGKENTREQVVASWQYILKYLKRGQSFYSGKNLSVIESGLGTIILEIKGHGKSIGQKQSATDYINSL